MAAKYCLNCGNKNDYSGAPPKSCAQCKTDFQTVAKDIIRIYKKEAALDPSFVKVEQENNLEEVEGSEFDSLMEEEPEAITQAEIEKIFLANASRGFNLRDFMRGELDKIEQTSKKQPKAKGTRKKSK